MYVVVCVGVTETPGERFWVAPLVEKLVPVQEEAFEDDHVSVDDSSLPISSGVAVSRTVGALGLMLTEYGRDQSERLPCESSASTVKVCVLEEFHECVVEVAVPLGTYCEKPGGAHSFTSSSSSQSMPYRMVSESGSVESEKVYS